MLSLLSNFYTVLVPVPHQWEQPIDAYVHLGTISIRTYVPFKFDSNLNGVRYGVTAECMYHSNLNGTNMLNDREGKRGMTE